MAKHSLWSEEYWLLLMQLYLKKPVGVKPLYSRKLVDLALELHIQPQFLYEQMFRLRQLDTPKIEQLWNTYGKSPKKLSREVSLLRQMNGFGHAEKFYENVEMNFSWEKDFKPCEGNPSLTPIKLIMVLDLYFRLVPITMVPETEEVIQLGKLIKVSPQEICDIMNVFQFCDPYLNHDDMMISPLLGPCQDIWQRYGNDNPEKLASLAAQLKVYFK
jgi:hypothetical protein